MALLARDSSVARDTWKRTSIATSTDPIQEGLEFLRRGGGRETSNMSLWEVMDSGCHGCSKKTMALITLLSCMALITLLCGVDHPLLVVVVCVAGPQVHVAAILVPLWRVQADTMLLLDQPSGTIVIPLLVYTLHVALPHMD